MARRHSHNEMRLDNVVVSAMRHIPVTVVVITLIGVTAVLRSAGIEHASAVTQPASVSQDARRPHRDLVEGQVYRFCLPGAEGVQFIDVLSREGEVQARTRFTRESEIRMILDVISRMKFVAGSGEAFKQE